jgi:hypothetical protein
MVPLQDPCGESRTSFLVEEAEFYNKRLPVQSSGSVIHGSRFSFAGNGWLIPLKILSAAPEEHGSVCREARL